MVSNKGKILDLAREYIPNFRKIRLYLLLFFTLTMPLVIYLGNTEYGYTKTIYTFVYISFLTLLWIGELLVKDDNIALTKLSLPVGLLLLSGLLSLINAPSKGVVLQSLALLIYFYLIYLLVANTIRTESEAKNLLVALTTSGVGATIYGVLQYFGAVRGAHGFRASATNIISVMGNQNYLAGFIAYLFIPTLVIILISHSKALKIYLSLSLGLFFFLLFPIGARGAWLSLIISFTVLGSLALYFKPIQPTRTIKFTFLAVVIILILAYLFASAPGPINSVLSFSKSESDGASWGVFTPVIRPIYRQLLEKGGARIEDWHIGWEMFKNHPFVGIGLGNYKIKFLEYRAKFLNSDKGENFGGHIPRGAQAHNEYVQFAAELGVIGMISILASLVLLIGNVFTRAVRPDSNSTRLLGFSLIAGLLGYLVHSTVSFPSHLPASSFAFVAFLGLLNSAAFGETDYEIGFDGVFRYVVFTLVTVFVIGVSVFAYRDWRANVLRGKGREQLNYGNFHLAKENFLQSASLDFQPRHTYYFLGLTERQLGNEASALEYFEKSKGQFEPYDLFLRLGTLYMNNGELDRAEEHLKKLVSMDPKKDQEIKANYYLAIIATRKDNIEEASQKLEWVLNEDPKFDRALILQGDIANFRGNEKTAREKFSQALKIINNKLEGIENKLSGEVQLENYGELQSKKEGLVERKERVEEKLDET